MQGYSWAEDKEHCEEYGRMLSANPAKVSQRAKKRGLPQVSTEPPLSAAPPTPTPLVVTCGSCLLWNARQTDCRCLMRLVVCLLCQMGTLGGGNHYAEIQVIDKVFDEVAARKMGIDQEGQVLRNTRPPLFASIVVFCAAVLTCMQAICLATGPSPSCSKSTFTLCMLTCLRKQEFHDAPTNEGDTMHAQVCIMLHSGSRGLGHQVATDALTSMDKAMSRDGIKVNDRQLACTRINSQVGP